MVYLNSPQQKRPGKFKVSLSRVWYASAARDHGTWSL